MKRYSISWFDLGPEPFWAETPGKAKYQAFKALLAVGYDVHFRSFCEGVHVLHHGEDTGDPRSPEYGVAV